MLTAETTSTRGVNYSGKLFTLHRRLISGDYRDVEPLDGPATFMTAYCGTITATEINTRVDVHRCSEDRYHSHAFLNAVGSVKLDLPTEQYSDRL